MIGAVLTARHLKGFRGDIDTKSRALAAALKEIQFVLNAIDGEHDVSRASRGFNGKQIAWLFEHGEEEDLATFSNADAFKWFIVVKFQWRSVVIPNIAVRKLSHDIYARKGRLGGEENVPPTGCWVVEGDAVIGTIRRRVMVIGGGGGCLVKPHEKRGFASPIAQIDHQTLRALRNFDFEVLQKTLITAQQSIFNTRRQGDGVVRVNVFRRIYEVGHDGERTCIAERVSRDVVQSWFNIEQVNFLFVSWPRRPCFHNGYGFVVFPGISSVKITGFFPPQRRFWRTVIRNTDVDIALSVIGSHAQIGQRFSDVHVIEIHVDVPVVVRVERDLLICDWDAFFQFRHVVQSGWRVGHVGVEFDEQLLHIGIKDHGEPHDAHLRPRPGIIEEAPFTKRGRIVIPFIWNFIGLGINGVFGHLLTFAKLERVGVPVQLSGVFLNFNEEQQCISLCGVLELVAFTNEQLNRLCHDASIGHDPICTFDAGHVGFGGIPCLSAFSLGEIEMQPNIHVGLV